MPRHWRRGRAILPLVMAKRKALPAGVRRYFQAQGREGGKLGGKLRWKGRTAAERSAHARLMVAAREAKRAANGGKKA